MNNKMTLALLVATLGTGAAGGWWLGRQHAVPTTSANTAGSKPLYWYDPMKPDAHFDAPGKSPFMDMALIPKYADEAGAQTPAVRIDPALAQNTGIKLATAEEGMLQEGLSAAGSVQFNDRDVAIVQARAAGIVERVHARAIGDVIAAGSPLADVRVPEWLAAQNEYLALRHDAQLAAAAKSRLLQLGMSNQQIAKLEQTGVPAAVVTVTAPRGGMVAELQVREGMTVAAGQTLVRINGLSTVWVEAEVAEAQAAAVQLGAPVQATFAAWPNAPQAGKVTALLPELNRDTRTVRVRIELPNKTGQLRPGMYARLLFSTEAGKPVLLVPSEAVIATGKRMVVIVADGQHGFRPAEVQIGRERDGKTEIVAGLSKGEQVVASGQFLVDSEASLKGVLARMASATNASAPAPAALTEHQGIGVVKGVSGQQVTLAHAPIPSLNWPAMTMAFEVASPELAQGVKAGDKVRFTLIERNGEQLIQSMTRAQP
ncbi:membrane fusion protein, Cu(I)/Ag(I) efflux system [Andreprevotia lacus DSM 23236]|jgi:Cu(I)/Ag(I) efflux system membrane fusion protein|uniref:Membrane fusion protein, Cu(I)/Ag(I) efflux system n=1 Tax=Andreprevotia lacus DSM 23236 TaxID=1121001 RepID=A0A1W1Y0S4_9NEIS|nr:efflux RND transporter periplasmic adaptor subunit [Andreprevotia lacus]SMC29391.1 membrane fusion protein, Cu(I)/Ag(I) efflux system [Andreprevotia lacus DSM 23236]